MGSRVWRAKKSRSFQYGQGSRWQVAQKRLSRQKVIGNNGTIWLVSNCDRDVNLFLLNVFQFWRRIRRLVLISTFRSSLCDLHLPVSFWSLRSYFHRSYDAWRRRLRNRRVACNHLQCFQRMCRLVHLDRPRPQFKLVHRPKGGFKWPRNLSCSDICC